MKRILIFLCNIYALTLCTPPRISKVYRSDYEYDKMNDAFYKLHIESASCEKAKKKCEVEGAKLMFPATNYDIVQLHGMLKRYPDLTNDVWISEASETNSDEQDPIIPMITNHEDDDNGYNYYDEDTTPSSTPKCEAMTRQGEIKSISCYLHRPFICKVEAKDAPYDSECDVFGTNYKYVASVGSCYMISKMAYSWNEAYGECQAQASHLVVLNSEAEHMAVKRIMQNTTIISNSYGPYYYIAGYRAQKPSRTFMTIFNQTLEEAGYSQWAATEPNNADGNEFCGSLYQVDGKLNDQNCKNIYGFICEKEKRV